jgi:hypothetical protein
MGQMGGGPPVLETPQPTGVAIMKKVWEIEENVRKRFPKLTK